LTNQAQAGAQMNQYTVGNEGKLRDDYTKASTNFKTVSENIKNIQTIGSRPSTAAGDLSLVFSYMKLLDPGSTVREGEYANAANAAGIPDRVRALWNRLNTGEKLAENQRADFINTAGDLYQGWADKQAPTDEFFRGTATRSGLNPENVLVPYGINNFDRSAWGKMPGAMGQGAPAPTPGQSTGGMVRVTDPNGRSGMIPQANLQKALARGYKAAQ
jgi:hypothetical protein